MQDFLEISKPTLHLLDTLKILHHSFSFRGEKKAFILLTIQITGWGCGISSIWCRLYDRYNKLTQGKYKSCQYHNSSHLRICLVSPKKSCFDKVMKTHFLSWKRRKIQLNQNDWYLLCAFFIWEWFAILAFYLVFSCFITVWLMSIFTFQR